MSAAPYWLLAGGVAALAIGYLAASLSGGPKSTFIDPRMSDEEIARQMSQSERGNPFAGFLILAGYLAIGVSVIWRITRRFM